MLCSHNINVMDKVTIQYGSLRKSYDIFSLPSQLYDFMEKEGFCLPRRKTIADVPNEILSLIFQRLDQKSLANVISVCQRFFDHGAPLLWSTVLCCVDTSQDDEDEFGSYLNRKAPTNFLELLARALSNTATNRSYELFTRKLNITAYDSLSAELCGSIEHLVGFIPNMSNLTHLELSIPLCEKRSLFFGRLRSNISLAFVELMILPGLEILKVEPLDLNIVCEVLETEYNFSLENLTIEDMYFGRCTMPVSDGNFKRLIQSFKVLKSLELWDVGTLSLSLWAEMTLSSESITHFGVNNAEFETVDHPTVLCSSKLESLLLLDICSDSETLRVFLSHMSLLTRLEFRDCRLSNIGAISPIADVIPQLEVFLYANLVDKFGPLVLSGFANPNCRLRKLSIESSLGGECVLKEFMGIPTLEKVCLFNTKVSATNLAEFFQSNTALRRVNLCYYPLDPSYLVPLLQHCPNIETFTTFEPVENSVQVLDEMVKNHPNLRLPMFQFDRVHGLKRNYEEYLRIFPRLANHLKFI